MSSAINEIRRALESGDSVSGIELSFVRQLYSNYNQLMDKVLGLAIVGEPDRTKENIVALVAYTVDLAYRLEEDQPRRIESCRETDLRARRDAALKYLDKGDIQSASANLRLMRIG